MVAVGVFAAAVALTGIGARATYGAQTSVDEPQYLLTALSLVEDADLDISDELERKAYRPFHALDLDQQTAPVDDEGRRFSPHDPLLPVILVPGMAVGGWVGAKVTLALLAGVTAAATCWVANRRFSVSPAVAAIVVGGFAVSMPMTAYGTQVYPELPAALAAVVAVGAATGPTFTRRHALVLVVAVVALPWLAVKYVPVAGTIAGLALWRAWRAHGRSLLGPMVAALAAAGVVYALVHLRIYGGFTVYAAGDHFAETGELSVVGTDPDHLGRSRRLIGLLVDRRFGLVGWSPIWFLAPFAVAWLTFARDLRHRWFLIAPVAAGWFTATFVALTMHGFWSPGRQVVVVVPLVAVAVAAFVERVRSLLLPAAILAALGLINWLWLAWESTTDGRTIVVDFFETEALPYRAISWALPDGVAATTADDTLLAVWAIALVAAIVGAILVLNRGGRRSPRSVRS